MWISQNGEEMKEYKITESNMIKYISSGCGVFFLPLFTVNNSTIILIRSFQAGLSPTPTVMLRRSKY